MRQQMQMPNPAIGYLSATADARANRHSVAIDRTRMIRRTFAEMACL